MAERKKTKKPARAAAHSASRTRPAKRTAEHRKPQMTKAEREQQRLRDLERAKQRNQVFAVYLAEPVADFLAATVTGLMFAWKFPRILRRREKELGAA